MTIKWPWTGDKPEGYFERLISIDEEDPFPVDWASAAPILKLSAAERRFYGKWASEEREKLRRAGLKPLDEYSHVIDAFMYSYANSLEKEGLRLIPEDYRDPDMDFYVDGKRVNFHKEESDLRKLEISQELDRQVSDAIDNIPWEHATDLDKLRAVADAISVCDLKENGLSVENIPSLATGGYAVKSKYKVGKYYSAGKRLYRISSIEGRSITADIYREHKDYFVRNDQFYIGSDVDAALRPASKCEVELFERAEHFRRQNRKLNEFKGGDIILDKCTGILSIVDIAWLGNRLRLPSRNIVLVCPAEKRGDKLVN